ncbi:glycoside hydrolase family 95 protein [Vallitalea okinawensis]|uniref:glycoside hydrolase family 95 protein n=1 Tax=Vallitalea okinawensis TaxID=2078660 RepID=UPI000CFDCEBB|nr:glycoside hydrolase family 95 protein [Vallitalea okinawensis]
MQTSRLWYRQSAKNWNEALPLGNGHMAAMVYSGEEIDRIQLNDDTLWSGIPFQPTEKDLTDKLKEVRLLLKQGEYLKAQKIVEDHMLGAWNQSYISLGELQLHHYDTAGDVETYQRQLHIDDARLETSYRIKNCLYKREYFISGKDDIMAIKYTATEAKLNVGIHLASLLKDQVTVNDNRYVFKGHAPLHIEPEYANITPSINWDKAMSFELQIQVETDGQIITRGEELTVLDATVIVYYITSATSYNGYNKDPRHEGKDPSAECSSKLDNIHNLTYEEILSRHVRDYHTLYNRVNFQLDIDAKDDIPTDIRIKNYKNGEQDEYLFKLLFDFGRYMVISGSRPGTQPLTLQGKWNKDLRPYWSSNLTVNINVQMNYWTAESCNLSECHSPLFDLLKEISETGRLTADSYGCRGWAAHHNLDIWRNTIATGEKNPKPGKARHAFWPFSGVWLCQHLWERYDFTRDQSFLKEIAYPIMKDAALFCLDWLEEDEDGTFMSSPSTSPENQFFTSNGNQCAVSRSTTMDIAMFKDLFGNVIASSEILDLDIELRNQLIDALNRLPDYQIGQHGQLQEWYHDFEEFEPGHRHQSHLFALYPGKSITPLSTPELSDACKKSIERRLEHGGGYTGWSCAWIINLYARLLSTDGVHQSLSTLMSHSIYTNMMDAHPPMQADGNYGAIAGITEALLQSHEGFIRFIPALPKVWPKGTIKGLRARGGFEVAMGWDNNQLSEAKIISLCGEKLSFYTDSNEIIKIYNKDDEVDYQQEGQIITLNTEPNKSYHIIFS